MNFCWITLQVKNLEASLAFYHGVLGLPIDSKHGGNGMEMAMLGEENQPKIELIHMAGNDEKTFSSDISVGIAVESMESAMAQLETHQIPLLRGPISPAPDVSFFFIQDPDGYEVQLVEMKKHREYENK
jgi:lactoylglutathione lyase